MPNVIIFHHALGVTHGIESFADQLRQAGYWVDVPDLFDGRVFDSIEAGVGGAREQYIVVAELLLVAHMLAGDPIGDFVVPTLLPVLAWLGVYTIDERLRALLPIRR